MLLVLVRHGRAARGGACADADRPLTRAGELQALSLGQAFVRLGLRHARVWTSPALRCRRTSELLASVADLDPAQVHDSLAAGVGARAILAAMSAAPAHPSPSQWILVGHQPDLEDLAAQLLGLDTARIALPPGGCIALDHTPESPATLRWALPPDLFRAVDVSPGSH